MFISKKENSYFFEDTVYGQKVSVYIGENEERNKQFFEKLKMFYDLKLELVKEFELEVPKAYLNYNEVEELSRIKVIYDIYKFLTPKEEIDKYYEKWYIDYVHATVAIEGNNLNEGQTKDILEGKEIISPELRDIHEVKNYKSLRDFLTYIKFKPEINYVLKIHNIILSNISNKYKGKFRNVDVYLTNTSFELAPFSLVREELQNALDNYEKENIHYFEKIAIFHQRFEEIHPFIDGNGRTGRELINTMLMQNNMPPLIIPFKLRDEYINSLRKGNNFEHEYLIRFLYNILKEQSEFFEFIIEKKGLNLS